MESSKSILGDVPGKFLPASVPLMAMLFPHCKSARTILHGEKKELTYQGAQTTTQPPEQA